MAMDPQTNTLSVVSLTLSVVGWVCMKIFLFLGIQNIADLASFVVIMSGAFAIAANSDRAINNVKKFINYIKSIFK